ncbi:MAG: hypothetical protein IH576_02485 [Deltaproteobacteria bacterium]|nr:hypothetical protein [Deltaproteobacteria bacterium]
MKIHRVSSVVFAILLAVLFIGCGGDDDSIATQAPSIVGGSLVISDITQTGASISAVVNPNGSDTRVIFLVSENDSYTLNTHTVDYGDIGHGDTNVTVTTTVGSLSDNTLYYCRVSAINLFGQRSEEVTFQTLP